MQKDAINQRFIDAIDFLLKEKIVSRKSEFCDIFGIGYSKFSEILGKRMNVGVDILAILCEKYNISSIWLLTGKEEMVQKEPFHDNSELTIDSEMIRDLSKSIKELSGTLNSLTETFNNLITKK